MQCAINSRLEEVPQVVVHVLSIPSKTRLCTPHLIHVEQSFSIVLARGQGGITALVPRGAPGAELADPPPPA